MINVFFSYAHEDEYFRDELAKHLAVMRRSGLVNMWHDRRIPAGGSLNDEISQHLEEADVILLLISSNFLDSDYCYEREGQRALEKAREGSAVTIPIVLQPCDWQHSPFGELLASPRDGKPVASFRNIHEAFLQITQDIREVAERGGKGESETGTLPAAQVDEPVTSRDTKAPSVASASASAQEASEDFAVEIVSVERIDEQGRAVSVDIANASGQLDVVVRVAWHGAPPAEVIAGIAVGSRSIHNRQLLSAPQGSDNALLRLPINTVAFNAATGVPALNNGAMSITAAARSNRTHSVVERRGVLRNRDGVILIVSFSPYAVSGGQQVSTKTTDKYGFEWRHGTVLVSAWPVLYSGRVISSLSITLPGANRPSQVLSAPPFTAVWPVRTGDASVPNVIGCRLVHPSLFESNGITPQEISPSILALDRHGNELDLQLLSDPRSIRFRLDNTP